MLANDGAQDAHRRVLVGRFQQDTCSLQDLAAGRQQPPRFDPGASVVFEGREAYVLESKGPDTRIELIIVHDTEYSFGRRADFFSYHLPSSVDIDTLVYTPAEFDDAVENLPALGKAVREGREIYHA